MSTIEMLGTPEPERQPEGVRPDIVLPHLTGDARINFALELLKGECEQVLLLFHRGGKAGMSGAGMLPAPVAGNPHLNAQHEELVRIDFFSRMSAEAMIHCGMMAIAAGVPHADVAKHCEQIWDHIRGLIKAQKAAKAGEN